MLVFLIDSEGFDVEGFCVCIANIFNLEIVQINLLNLAFGPVREYIAVVADVSEIHNVILAQKHLIEDRLCPLYLNQTFISC
jgi:hypothetical protein